MGATDEDLEERVRVARIVADHWRRAALDGRDELVVMAHPLCMVLAALDGETDPVQLGVTGEDAEAIRGEDAFGHAAEITSDFLSPMWNVECPCGYEARGIASYEAALAVVMKHA